MLRNPLYVVLGFLFLLLIVIGHSFKTYFFDKNFQVDTTLPCDPSFHSCFTMNCPSGETCESGPYRKINLSASEVPLCLEERTCPNFVCNNEIGCEQVFCSDSTKEEGEQCVVKNSSI